MEDADHFKEKWGNFFIIWKAPKGLSIFRIGKGCIEYFGYNHGMGEERSWIQGIGVKST